MHTVVFKTIKKSEPYKQRVHLIQKAVVEENSDAFVINTDTDNQLSFAVKLFNG